MRWLLLLAVAGAVAIEAQAARPTVEGDVRALEMIQAGDRLALKGDQGEAVEKYRAIVRLYPQSYSAPKAQLQIGDLLAANREHASAFEAYQALIDRFPASNLFTPALEGQFAIAQRIMDAHHHADQKGVKPPRTIPDRETLATMLRQILQNGRHARFSPLLQYQVAIALDRVGDSREAIAEFWRFLGTYPEDALADDAAFQIGFVEYRQAREPNRERSARERATVAFDYFLTHYPGSEKVPEAAHLLALMKSWDTTALRQTGDLYERTGKPAAALKTYNDALKSAPEDDEARKVSERIEALKKRMR